ncbi:hypothetical protein XF36_17285 [Pseudonocardia sp. HH130629-09]|nr:hypothetical protein XF36_17285 [Pseudonocardia sp. HH130629-09]
MGRAAGGPLTCAFAMDGPVGFERWKVGVAPLVEDGSDRWAPPPAGHATGKQVSSVGLGDKISNKAEELGGKAKEATGEATDDKDLQAEGKADQATGNLKQAGEKLKDTFKS